MKKSSVLKSVLIILILALVGFYFYPYAQGNKQIQEAHLDWMESLDDEIKLNQMALVGSHDAMAYYSDFPYASRCQSLTLEKQLEAGVRVFDLRLEKNKDQWIFHHGPCKCRKGIFQKPITFDECKQTMENFLEDHPSEFIICLVAIDEKDLEAFHSQYPQLFEIHQDTPLKDLRSNLYILTRGYQVTSDPTTISWVDQKNLSYEKDPFEKGSMLEKDFYVQDHFCYEIEDKKQAFLMMPYQQYCFNFLSTKGNRKIASPYEYAKELNEWFLNSSIQQPGCTYFFDFVDDQLADRVIQMNQSIQKQVQQVKNILEPTENEEDLQEDLNKENQEVEQEETQVDDEDQSSDQTSSEKDRVE